ncbi:hypothetical protein BDZ89DRAFT_1068397 [Hymenopellis radicata]|nr:hypothetical protein BDZ89DRAFT_1068397 [Hymenopellis radicata]
MANGIRPYDMRRKLPQDQKLASCLMHRRGVSIALWGFADSDIAAEDWSLDVFPNCYRNRELTLIQIESRASLKVHAGEGVRKNDAEVPVNAFNSICPSTLNRVEDAWGPKYLLRKTNWFAGSACAERGLDTSQGGDDGIGTKKSVKRKQGLDVSVLRARGRIRKEWYIRQSQ